MATQSTPPNEAPRSEEARPDPDAPVPDEAGPHDVPDDEVIEQTLPRRKDGDRPA